MSNSEILKKAKELVELLEKTGKIWQGGIIRTEARRYLPDYRKA